MKINQKLFNTDEKFIVTLYDLNCIRIYKLEEQTKTIFEKQKNKPFFKN
jgi:hypothetical protein